MKDAHKTINTENTKFTITASNNVRRRLDKFLYSANLQNRLEDYYIKPNSFSDHEGIGLTIYRDVRRKWGERDIENK